MTQENHAPSAPKAGRQFRPGMWPALLATLVAAVVVWWALAVNLRNAAIGEIEQDLLTINNYKSAELVDWLDYRRREALRLSRHPFLAEIVSAELARPGSRRPQLNAWLTDHATQKKYSGMALLTPKGAKIVATADYSAGPQKEFREGFAQAAEKGKPLLTDLYLSAAGRPRLTMFSPVFSGGHGGRPVCVLVATIDPETDFYPLVKAAPLFFARAETLLVRREGDHALFLNHLAYYPGAALKLKMPLSMEQLPAAAALRGHTGFFTGTDYRGKQVFSAISRISGTDWAVITKIDRDIIMAPVKIRELLALALLALVGVLAFILVSALLRARARGAQEKIQEGERRLAALFSNLPGLAYRCRNDRRWTMEFLSQGCQRLTGYQPEALVGNKELSFNDLILPEDRARVWQTIQEQIASGGVYLANYAIKSKSGEIRSVWDQGQAVRGEDGSITALEGYIQDITPLKRAEAGLRESEAIFSMFMEHSPVYVFFKDENIRALRLSRNFEQLLGRPMHELLGRTMDDLFPSDLAKKMIADDKFILAEGKEIEVEEEFNGRFYSTIKFPIALEGKPAYLAGYTMDITEKKRAEGINLARIRLLQFAARHTLDELLEETLNEAERISGSLIGFIHFLEEDQETLRLQNWSTRTKAQFCKADGKGSHYALSKAGVWTDCIRERRAVIHNDYASLPHRKGLPPGHAPVKRELVVPVFRGEKIVAILGVGNKPADYGEEDIRVISLLADLAWEIAERKKAEEGLAKARERLELAAGAARLGVWDWDVVNNALVWDDRMLQLYGLKKDSFEGAYEAWLKGLHPDDRDRAEAATRLALLGEAGCDTEFRVVWPDGSVRHIKADGVVFRDPAGKPVRMVGVNYDITESRRLQESVAKLNHLQAEAERIGKVGGWEVFLETGKQVWTQETRNIHEVGPDFEPTVENGLGFYTPASRPVIEEAVRRAVELGEPFDVELQLLTAKGNIREVHAVGKADKAGKRIFGFIQDITDRKRSEAKLIESERRLSLALDVGEAGVWEWDRKTNRVYYDDRFNAMLGYGPGELPDTLEGVLPYHHPGDLPAWSAKVERYLKGELPYYESEHRMRGKSGEWEWVFTRGQLEKTPAAHGEQPKFVGIAMNITARKKAEEALRRTEADNKRTLENLLVGVVAHAADTSILWCNTQAQNILGLTLEQMAGKKAIDPAWSFIKENQEKLPLEEYPVNRVIASKEPFSDMALGILRPDRDYVTWVNAGATPVFGEGGELEKVIVNFSDITSRKEAEAALQDSLKLLDATGRLAKIGGWQLDVEANSLEWTQETRVIHEVPADFTPDVAKAIGFYAPEDQPRIGAAVKAAIEDGKPFDIELGVITAKGNRIDVQAIGIPEVHAGKTVKVWGTFQDITERKAAREALAAAAAEVNAKNKELEDLLYIASHDLRSPLVNLQGFSENLARYFMEINADAACKTSPRLAELLDKKIPEALNFISGSSAKMDAQINGLLKVSRLGRVPLNMARLDMANFMAGLLATLAFQAKEAGAEIKLAELPECLGDPAQLSHVFTNLIENAIKYRSPERPLEIEISGRLEGGMAEYSVADNGRGLTEAEAAGSVWAMFYRGAGKGEVKGEGIGLTAAKRIVERHGGSVRAERLANGGAKFTVRLRAWGG